MLTRRGLLTGLGLALAAPAIVRADNLMRVRGIIVPRPRYSFSAWVRTETVPAPVVLSLDDVVSKTFTVTADWTRVHMDMEGPVLPNISVSPINTTVQIYAAQLERRA